MCLFGIVAVRAHQKCPSGKIDWVQIDLGGDDHDHFIDPEERLRIAMACHQR